MVDTKTKVTKAEEKAPAVGKPEAPPEAPKLSRYEVIKAEVANALSAEIAALEKQGLKGYALTLAHIAVGAKIDRQAKDRLDTEVKVFNERVTAQTKATANETVEIKRLERRSCAVDRQPIV